MVSGHGANPIFSNKKIKIGHPGHSLTPPPPPPSLCPITSCFCLNRPPPLRVDVICVPPLNGYLRIPLRKNLFIDSLVEKIMEMQNASIFNFIILNLVKKSVLDFPCYYSH